MDGDVLKKGDVQIIARMSKYGCETIYELEK